MRLVENIRDVERYDDDNNNNQSSSFKVNASAKAFKILSSSLYKNKIRAVIRELSTNCVDAHTLVNKIDVPFHMHLPNSLQPYFSVRDFGPGIAYENMNDIYCVYFSSSKTHSDLFTGALGLGCKSPFSYTDNYTVISRHEGVQRTYTLYMDENDCPVVSQLGNPIIINDNSVEPNGLEVRMSVNNSDITTFRNEALNVLEYFQVKPEISGFSNDEFYKLLKDNIEKKSEFIVGTDYTLYKRNYYNNYNSSDNNYENSVVIMGNIAYPFDLNNVVSQTSSTTYEGTSLKRLGEILSGTYIHLHVPMGSVDFTAGREELSYDKTITIPYLKKKLVQTYEDIRNKYEQKIANFDSEYAAILFYVENKFNNLFRSFTDLIKYNNKVINKDHILIDMSEYSSHFQVLNMNRFRTNIEINNTKPFARITINKQLVFFVNDCKNARNKIKSYVKDYTNNIEKYFCYYLNSSKENDIDKFLLNFPGARVIRSSTLPSPDKKIINTDNKRKISVKILCDKNNPTVFSTNTKNLKDTQIEFDKGGIFVLSYGTVIKADNYGDISSDLLKSMVGILDKDTTVYVVPKTLSERFLQSKEWKSLETISAENFNLKHKNYDYDLLYSSQNVRLDMNYSYVKLYSFSNYALSKILKNDGLNAIHAKSLKDFNDRMENIKTLRDQADSIIPLAEKFNLFDPNKHKQSNSITIKNELEKSFNDVILNYPLLYLIESHNLSNDNVINYVILCDKHNNTIINS